METEANTAYSRKKKGFSRLKKSASPIRLLVEFKATKSGPVSTGPAHRRLCGRFFLRDVTWEDKSLSSAQCTTHTQHELSTDFTLSAQCRVHVLSI